MEQPNNKTSNYAAYNSIAFEDWSSLLYKDEGYNDPQSPKEGMFLGSGPFKRLGIATWIRLYAYKNMKSVELKKGSNSTYKKWNCSCTDCGWFVSVRTSHDVNDTFSQPDW